MIALCAGALLCSGATHRGTMLQLDAPKEITVHYSVPPDLIFHVTGQDSASPVFVGASGLPAGLFVVQGNPPDARVQLRVYGIVNEGGSKDSVYHVTWYVKNGTTTRYVNSRLHVDAPRDTEDLAHRVEELVTSRYSHGIPQREAHV